MRVINMLDGIHESTILRCISVQKKDSGSSDMVSVLCPKLLKILSAVFHVIQGVVILLWHEANEKNSWPHLTAASLSV